MRERLLAVAALEAVQWRDEALYLLDLRSLPNETHWHCCQTVADVAEAIRLSVVQGASAVAISAAYGLVLGLKQHLAQDGWRAAVEEDYETLVHAHPTSINLIWALNQMIDCMDALEDDQDIYSALLQMARHIQESDREANVAMAELGAELILEHLDEPQALLTHGLTGALATAGVGSGLGVVHALAVAKKLTHVYVTEGLPIGSGKLNAWELTQGQIDTKLCSDSAVAHLLKTQAITWVVVGADCISANGDVLGALGTYQLAINAMHHGVRVMVVAPTSSIDLASPSVEDLALDDVADAELEMAVQASGAWVDVTPADLIDYLVTEKGIIGRPNREKIAQLMCRKRLH